VELFLVHPGGPYWARKDLGSWSIPKGEYETGEDPQSVARREFLEETGCEANGFLVPLPPVKLRSGKVISSWAVEGSCDAAAIRSNEFSMEWPPKSGRMVQFPEVDRAGWFTPDEARAKLAPGQVPIVDALLEHLGVRD
jgi:predicted NUDIX family NTP pyrophosphohydrolase